MAKALNGYMPRIFLMNSLLLNLKDALKIQLLFTIFLLIKSRSYNIMKNREFSKNLNFKTAKKSLDIMIFIIIIHFQNQRIDFLDYQNLN